VVLSHYEVLGIEPDADLATIRAAYRRRARETHPDTGGDDATFAAVALAWWTLSTPDRRAQYDAGTDDADEDDWGEDLAWDAPADPPAPPGRPEPPAPAPRDVPGPRPAHKPSHGPAPESTDPPEGPRPPIDPLAARPAALPAPARPSGLTDAYAPHLRRRGLIACAAILLLIAAPIAFPSLADGTGPLGDTDIVVIAAYATLLWLGLWFRARTHEAGCAARVTAATAVWGALTLGAFFGAGAIIDGPFSAPQLLLHVIAWTTGLVLVLLSGHRVRRARARAALDRDARRRHALARRWNRVLRMRAQHGHAHVEAGERKGRTVWLLVSDTSGHVLDWAPAAAPRAWRQLLHEAGVDVAPVPDPAVPAAR
jgi:hypothetical protein